MHVGGYGTLLPAEVHASPENFNTEIGLPLAVLGAPAGTEVVVLEMGMRGITSGYLMAAMVWLVPAARVAQFHIVLLMTYLIGVGNFAHIVAGSVEAFLLVANGELGPWSMLGGFTLPVLVGNIVGGTALFALISYAQVMKEI